MFALARRVEFGKLAIQSLPKTLNSDLQFFESGSVEGLTPTLCSKGHLFPFDACPLTNLSVHFLQSLASIPVVWHPIERLWNPNRFVTFLVVVLLVSCQ